MSDFGFDTAALAGGDATPPSHPLKIARELIAAGRPRDALDVLGEHHDLLADDPEYLLACSEAWWAEGDALRAQQALLGAARLVPEDPTPLVLLSELLRQGGELEKADRVLAKAEALGEGPRLSVPEAPPYEDDLIAVAELQERRTHVVLTPKRALVASAVLLGVSVVVVAIGKVTETETQPVETTEPILVEEEPAQVRVPEETKPTARAEPEPEVEPAPTPSVNALQADTLQEETGEVDPVVVPDVTSPPVVPIIDSAMPKRSVSVSKPKPLLSLSSQDPEALTREGDMLHAKGKTGLAAAYYRRALELDPDYAPALIGIGRSILRAENYEEAFANSTRALQLARGVDSRPGLEAEAIYQLGRVHLHRGDRDAARRLFRQATSLPASPADAWFYLGEALWNDNSPAARSAYETFLERVPSGPLAERARRAIQ